YVRRIAVSSTQVGLVSVSALAGRHDADVISLTRPPVNTPYLSCPIVLLRLPHAVSSICLEKGRVFKTSPRAYRPSLTDQIFATLGGHNHRQRRPANPHTAPSLRKMAR